jgi:hypothetical protein
MELAGKWDERLSPQDRDEGFLRQLRLQKRREYFATAKSPYGNPDAVQKSFLWTPSI